MSDDYTMYRMFYFFLFAYAAYTCMSACIRGSRGSSDDEQRNPNDENGNTVFAGSGSNEPRETPAEEKAKRLDLVRGRLEFRKILASSTPGKEFELGPPIEPDLEQGEGGRSNTNNIDENINRSSLQLLSEMGFTYNASRRALNAVGGSDTEAAMDWIFDHQDDPDLDSDPAPQTSPGASRTLTPYVEQEDSKISANERNRLDSSVRSFLNSGMSLLGKVGLMDSKHEAECCSICLEPYKVGDTVARLKRTPEQLERERNGTSTAEDHHHDGECNHWFHEDCILEWLQNHDECPLCRVNMIAQVRAMVHRTGEF